MKKTVPPPPSDERLDHDPPSDDAPPSTGPMSKEARLALMRERHMGTAKVSVVEIELAIELSKKGVNKEVEDRLQRRQGHGITTTPIDPFELQARLEALGPEVLSAEDDDDEVADATRRVNTKALLEQLSQHGLESPLTMPIELADIIELQELAQAHPAQGLMPMTMRLDESDLELLEHSAAQSIQMPLLPVEELLPETTKLERSSLAQALRGESMTKTGELRTEPKDEPQSPEVLPGVPKNFGVESLHGPRTPDQVETARFHLSHLQGVGITPQAPPTLHRPTQTKKPPLRGQDKLIAATLAIVFMLVGVALGWMAIQCPL